MQICQLSQSEANRMVHFGVLPDCHSHMHLSKRDAEQAFKDRRVEFISRRAVVIVDEKLGSKYWYNKAVKTNDRYLGAARSGRVRTMQLVKFMPRGMNHRVHVQACDAHGCSMTAKAVNEPPCALPTSDRIGGQE